MGDLRAVEASLLEIAGEPGGHLASLACGTLEAGGKRLRPALVLICGQIAEYDLGRLLAPATAVELVHTASLVHDDILDRAATRRGRPTLYAAEGDRTATAVGDFLFAQAFRCLASLGDERALSVLSESAIALCHGEFDQMRTAFSSAHSLDEYFDKIGEKTAALFAASCQLGGLVSGATEREISLFAAYGYDLGLAFQIYDDILDIIGGPELGKPVGTDLRDGTMTMPMYFAIEELAEGAPLISVIEAKEPDEEAVARAIELIRETTAIERAKERARAFVESAIKAADGLEAGELSRQLAAIGEFVIDRYH